MRLEESAARMIAMYLNFNTKNGGYKLTRFMPHYEEPKVPISLNEAMEHWE